MDRSALLLIFSILKSTRTEKIERNHIDQVHISLLKEINSIQESVRNTELDIEVAFGRMEFTYHQRKKLSGAVY